MRTTTRIRFNRKDVIEWNEWGTPLGSVVFKPTDGDYESCNLDRRVELFIDGEYIGVGIIADVVSLLNRKIIQLLK